MECNGGMESRLQDVSDVQSLFAGYIVSGCFPFAPCDVTHIFMWGAYFVRVALGVRNAVQ